MKHNHILLKPAVYLKNIQKKLLDEEENKRLVGTAVYAVLALVAAVMTVMNLFTHKDFLIWATGIFTVLCIVNLLLVRAGGKRRVDTAAIFFVVEVIVMFTYFLISGNPEGFSAIWICVLPSASMLFFDRKKGTIVCAVMLVILIALLWTPLGPALNIYEGYTASFKMRFPILFIAFYLLAFFLESLRSFTLVELNKVSAINKGLSMHDQLTGVYNRSGMYDSMKKRALNKVYRRIGIVILDIDYFKVVNDTYGHSAGDEVLRELADMMQHMLKATIVRWGGEEFAIVYYDEDVTSRDLEAFRRAVEEQRFFYDGNEIAITVSLGVFETTGQDLAQMPVWIKNADTALYQAKTGGRNRIIYF